MIEIELWGGPVDGHIAQVDELRSVWHVPLVAAVDYGDGAGYLVDTGTDGPPVALYERRYAVPVVRGDVPHESAPWERGVWPVRYVYTGMA